MRFLFLGLLVTIALWSGRVAAEEEEDRQKAVDTVLYQPAGELDEFAVVTSDANLERKLTQNPTLGLFKSMVLPGLGQFGNRKYIKALVYFGLDAWMVAEALHYRNLAGHRRDLFESATDTGWRNHFYGEYQHFKDRRNRYTWFAVIITLLSMFDAYVDAHLSGFPTADRSVGWEMTPGEDGGFRAAVTFSF